MTFGIFFKLFLGRSFLELLFTVFIFSVFFRLPFFLYFHFLLFVLLSFVSLASIFLFTLFCLSFLSMSFFLPCHKLSEPRRRRPGTWREELLSVYVSILLSFFCLSFFSMTFFYFLYFFFFLFSFFLPCHKLSEPRRRRPGTWREELLRASTPPPSGASTRETARTSRSWKSKKKHFKSSLLLSF